MEKTIFIIIILFSLGCSSNQRLKKSKLTGKFIWKGSYGVSESLKFNPDSTFVFEWKQGLINGVTKGKIEYNNNQIVLQSEIKSRFVSYELGNRNYAEQDYFYIKILDEESNSVSDASCVGFRNKQIVKSITSDIKGVCKLNSIEIDSLFVRFAGYNNVELKIDSETPKSITINMKEEKHYHYFEEQKINIINKNKIKLSTFGKVKLFKRMNNET